MRKISVQAACAALLMALTVTSLADCSPPAQANHPRIAIVYTSPHPIINDIIVGFKDTVRAAYPDAEFVERHANGRPEEYSSTVLAVLNSHPTLVAPITTPITRLAIEQARGSVPVVFMGVTDPVGAHVAQSLEHPQIATGSSDLCPFASLLSLARQLKPDAHVLGLPYNPADQPAVFGRERLIALAPQYGFSIVDRQVSAASELEPAVRALASRSDAILIAADNLMLENPGAIVSAAQGAGKPTLSCDTGSVEAGAVAGVSVDYHEVGVLAGQQAIRILRGATAGDLPVAVVTSGSVSLNRHAACMVRIQVPADTARGAHVVDPDFQCTQH